MRSKRSLEAYDRCYNWLMLCVLFQIMLHQQLQVKNLLAMWNKVTKVFESGESRPDTLDANHIWFKAVLF